MKTAQAADYEEVERCLLCDSPRSEPVFDLEWKEVCRQRFAGAEPFRDTVGRLFIRRCLDCGLEYQSPRPTEDRLLAVISEGYEVRPLDDVRQPLFERDLRLLRRFLPPGSSLLDVGCNTGAFLDMARETYDVRGCDPCVRALDYGRLTLGLEQLYPGTIADAPLDQVDAIVSLDVFEHLHDPPAFMAEVCRRLRPGGLLFIRTIRRDGPNARLSGKYWYGYSIWHLLYPTIADTVRLCHRFGFDPLKIEVTRNGWPYLKDSLTYHSKRFLGTIFPVVPSLHQFNREVRGWKRHFSFFRDEFAAVFSYARPGNDDVKDDKRSCQG